MKSVKMLMVGLLVSGVVSLNARNSADPKLTPSEVQILELGHQAASTDIHAHNEFIGTFGTTMINGAKYYPEAIRYKTQMDLANESQDTALINSVRSHGGKSAHELMANPTVYSLTTYKLYPAGPRATK